MEKKRKRKPRESSSSKRRAGTKSARPAAGPEPLPPGPDLRLPPRHAMEQFNRLIGKVLGEREFESEEEMNAFLQDFIAGQTIDEMVAEEGQSPEDKAFDLAAQASETDDIGERMDLLDRALDLDPACLDALTQVAGLTAGSRAELIRMVQDAVEIGEETLGEDFFEEHRGHFWGIVETRPYMRVRCDLVVLLQRSGKTKEAIRHCEEMLELNPTDNQGMRDILLGLYLETKNLKGARRLFEQYGDDYPAVFTWGRVLERFLSGDLAGAAEKYDQAYEGNPFVFDFLTGAVEMPLEGLDYYSPGTPTEAVHCCEHIGQAWKKHRGAVDWLKSIQEDRPES